MLTVAVECQNTIVAAGQSPIEASHQSCALAPVLVVAHDGGPGSFCHLGRIVLGAIIYDEYRQVAAG